MAHNDMTNELCPSYRPIIRNFLSLSVPFPRSINVAAFERCSNCKFT